ncbi:MAG TPA: hypothetical protein VM840_07515 [Actinomycetota bacterium]|nr:hypothetical protein [Actinomycetota bacterium]
MAALLTRLSRRLGLVTAMTSMAFMSAGLAAIASVDASTEIAVPLHEVPPGVSEHVLGRARVFIVRDRASVVVFWNRSPHLGRPMRWCESEGVFLDQRAWNVFDRAGRVFRGSPAVTGLFTFDSRIEGDRLLVDLSDPRHGPSGLSDPARGPIPRTTAFCVGSSS